MATATETLAPPITATEGGVWSWITTVDHKRIGVLYGVERDIKDAAKARGRDPTPDEVETVVFRTMQLAKTIDAASYMRATQAAHRLGRQMAAFHADYDVLLTPALGTLPPKLGWIDMTMDDLDVSLQRTFSTVFGEEPRNS